MQHYLFLLVTGLASATLSTVTHAQAGFAGTQAVGMVGAVVHQAAINRKIAARTTTTATYRGQSYPMKRTPDDLRAGDAPDRIERLEAQLARCHVALLADSTGLICPRARKDSLWAAMRYLGQVRPNWQLQAYRQELAFYATEDARRHRAAKLAR